MSLIFSIIFKHDISILFSPLEFFIHHYFLNPYLTSAFYFDKYYTLIKSVDFVHFLFIYTELNFDFSLKIYPSFLASSKATACVYRGNSDELHIHQTKNCENIPCLNIRLTILYYFNKN